MFAADTRKAAAAVAAAEDVIRQACERIGLPQPAKVTVVPTIALSGAQKPRFYGPFPREANRTRRALTHAILEFDRPVLGPILLGAGRFSGLGLFRPIRPEALDD